jgi:hypothetical protein
MEAKHSSPATKLSEAELVLLKRVVVALEDIQHGSITLTVHEGRLVEIQKTEKVRVRDQVQK